jgi:ferredoxin
LKPLSNVLFKGFNWKSLKAIPGKHFSDFNRYFPTGLLNINGTEHTLYIEPRVTLLDALRERMGFTGTKKGCNHGQCGACTVLVNGQRINSCLTLAAMQMGRAIVTIEGNCWFLVRHDRSHRLAQVDLISL